MAQAPYEWDDPNNPLRPPPAEPSKESKETPGQGGGFDFGSLLSAIPALFSGSGKGSAGTPTPSGSALPAGGTTNPDDLSKWMQQLSGQTAAQGAGMVGMGGAALDPVLKYLLSLVGGDETALAKAIQPEAAGVLSQYDTAKRAISEFSPRGGGRTAALAQLPTQAANQISQLTSQARTGAVNTLGTLGTTLTGQGTQAESAAMSSLSSLIASMTASKNASTNAWMGVLGDIGSAAMTAYLSRKK